MRGQCLKLMQDPLVWYSDFQIGVLGLWKKLFSGCYNGWEAQLAFGRRGQESQPPDLHCVGPSDPRGIQSS